MNQNNIDPKDFINLFTKRHVCCRGCFLRNVCIWESIFPRKCDEVSEHIEEYQNEWKAFYRFINPQPQKVRKHYYEEI